MMRTPHRRGRLRALCLAAAACLTTAALPPPPAAACSWDYRIWIPRHRDADPLYRFVRGGKAGYIDARGRRVFTYVYSPD